MSTIGEVRTAEKKMNNLMERLRNACPEDEIAFLEEELRRATDEYSKAVFELRVS